MHRVTINDIARRAGVSKGAVSYALNGRPGVSEETRHKILDVAHELGWAPNRTARMLSGSRTETFGLVLARDPRTLGSEPFYMEFIAGLQDELSQRGYALLLQLATSLADELELYPRWWSERRVDAVVIVDIRLDDPRVAAVRELDIPAVFVGDPSVTGGFTTVWTDDAAAMADAIASPGRARSPTFRTGRGPARSEPHPGAGPRLRSGRSHPRAVRGDRSRRLLRRRRSAGDPRPVVEGRAARR